MIRLDVRDIRGIDVDTALHDIEFVAFDTETTGLSPTMAKVVELSGVKFRLADDSVEVFSSLINPECFIPAQVTAVHGITNEMVADAPTAEEVIPDFFRWIGGPEVVLVAHNANFDLGFLKFAIAQQQLPVPPNQVIDTLSMSRRVLDDMPNYKLGTLVRELNLGEGTYHRALSDSHHVRNLLEHIVCERSAVSAWRDVVDLRCVHNFGIVAEEVDQFPYSAEFAETIKMIRRALRSRRDVSFNYRGIRLYQRTVSPTALIEDRGVFYLTGNCHRMREQRTFRLDRMSELLISDVRQLYFWQPSAM